MLGWVDANPKMPGFTWRTNGVQLVITPTSQPKSYIVQRTKMSDTTTKIMNETQLLAQIEGDSNE